MKTQRKVGLFVIGALCLVLAPAAQAAKSVQVKLTGQDDVNVDRPAIQAAIDSAPGEDLVVKLSGTFQLDGQDLVVARSNIVVKAVKEGATLNGKLDGGLPIDDIDNYPNRGIVIGSVDPLANIEIKDLVFTGLRSPVFVRAIENTVDNVTIKDNSVENSTFGYVVGGAASGVTIVGNQASSIHDSGIFIAAFGEQMSDIRVVDNEITDAWTGMHLFDAADTLVENNLFSALAGAPFAVAFLAESIGPGNSDILVTGNRLQGGAAAAVLLDNAVDFVITGNCIRDGGVGAHPAFVGGGIVVGAFGFYTGSGFEILDNSYESNVADPGPAPRDVWLTSLSSNNSVVERDGTVVLDEGTANAVTLVPDNGMDYCSN